MNNKSKKGFTIIEVVLVLAIAGLIFLMVFIALPALQRSQRNTQRRDDYSMLVTAVNSYMASNNGKLSTLASSDGILDASRWVNNTGTDPNGNPYEVTAYLIDNNGSNVVRPTSEITTGFCSILKSENCEQDGGAVSEGTGSQVFIYIHADCGDSDANGDPKPRYNTAARAFAVYGYLEGGSVFCQDSGAN